MTRANILWALALAIILSLAYTRELRDAGVMQERERVYRADIIRLRARGDSAIVRAHAESARATRLASVAASAVSRRGRAVASTDSVVTRVDSALADTRADRESTETDSAHLARLRTLVVEIRASVLSERLASDSAIASLSSALDASASALRVSESVVSALQARLAVQDSLIAVLTRKAHPSFLTRVKRDAVKVASGMVLMAVWMASK